MTKQDAAVLKRHRFLSEMAGPKTATSAEAHEEKHLANDIEVNLDETNKDNPTESSLYSGEEEIDGDYGSYHDHVFKDPQIAEHWRNIYEKAEYEGRHRFDPNFTWSATEEKKLKRKVSTLVMLSTEYNIF